MDGRSTAEVLNEVSTMFALVGGNSGENEYHSDIWLRLAAAGLKNRISVGLRLGNPDTLASATSRCVERRCALGSSRLRRVLRIRRNKHGAFGCHRVDSEEG